MKLMKLLLVLSGLLFAASAFADTTWVASGNVSGVWAASGSPYVVHTGDITVATGDALLIEPGVRVYFAGNFKLVVNGLLQAIGTESDSIWFTGDPSGFPYDSPTRWRGLRFMDAHADCELRYCSVTYSGATGAGALSYGGGLYCYNSDVRVSHSWIRQCHATLRGCGAYFDGSDIELEYTMITNNIATIHPDQYPMGESAAGFMASNSIVHVRHCTVAFNSNGGDVGGITVDMGTVITLDTCLIDNNSSIDQTIGGMRADAGCYVHMTGTTISNNHSAWGQIGGLQCRNVAELTMEACTLRANFTYNGSWGYDPWDGGGGANIRDPGLAAISNSVFEGHSCRLGAALLCNNTMVINSVFRNNRATDGGAIGSNGNNTLIGCRFEDNQAGIDAGCMSCDGDGTGGAIRFVQGTDSVFGCWFEDNHSIIIIWEESGGEYIEHDLGGFGGAMHCMAAASPYVANSVFVNNSLDYPDGNGSGSVLYNAGGSPTFEFCTMNDNSASGHPGGVIFMDGGALTMNSCVVSNSTASCAIFFDQGATGDIDYCDFFGISGVNFRGVPPTGLGTISTVNVNGDPCDLYYNIYLDPQYVDAVNGNLHLTGASPCVDAADPASSVLSDFDGNARPNGAYADLGAFEYSRAAVTDLVIFADVANGDATLYWSAVAGASGYEIYRGDTQDYEPGNSVLIGTTTATTFTDDDVFLAATEQRAYVVVVVMP